MSATQFEKDTTIASRLLEKMPFPTHEALTALHDQHSVRLNNPRMTQLQWPCTSLDVRPWRSLLKRINCKRSGA
ncbi:hypothetical protein ALQ28_04045 [Pseudomonas syringae pv. delphinii]|uniref:Uncharacterized protein n=1 Tax=Pseudomonas syringae pv. delphinii TaxID=192088 RepID=A0A0P9RNY4_9PSED|nr:Uncharacterized protein ALO72_04719 [Pseudomonas syringae pv. delphinii]RMP17647.1 hypothetical protein ALQ28_04045 [Pseudomonas syringae pv. delphinii]